MIYHWWDIHDFVSIFSLSVHVTAMLAIDLLLVVFNTRSCFFRSGLLLWFYNEFASSSISYSLGCWYPYCKGTMKELLMFFWCCNQQSCWELGFCQRHSPKFYVERCGCSIGIFMSWLECMKQVQGFWRAEFKKFRIWNKANEYLQLKRQV